MKLIIICFTIPFIYSILVTYVDSANVKRSKRKIDFSSKTNEVSDLDENVVVYSEGEGVIFDGAFSPTADIISAIQNVYDALSERMDSLRTRLSRVEERTDEIVDRLNLMDCYDAKIENPRALSDVYSFHLDYKGKRPVSVFCDMVTEGGGWTVFQQRLPRDVNQSMSHTRFSKNFHDYQVGFGSAYDDYWLGLENLYLLTNSRQYEMMVQLTDFSNQRSHAHYKNFYIEDEAHGYRLHVSGYSGDAGDSLSSDKEYDNFTADGMMFSTHDRDRDTSHEINCSTFWNIGGWWFNRCSWANLNGPYTFPVAGEDCIGINWHKWRNKQCLKASTMMIRPARQA